MRPRLRTDIVCPEATRSPAKDRGIASDLAQMFPWAGLFCHIATTKKRRDQIAFVTCDIAQIAWYFYTWVSFAAKGKQKDRIELKRNC
jgi:hypothetical protein